MAGESKAEGGNYAERRSRLQTSAPFETGHRSLSAPPLPDDALSMISEELADHVLTLAYRDIQVSLIRVNQQSHAQWLIRRSSFHSVNTVSSTGYGSARSFHIESRSVKQLDFQAHQKRREQELSSFGSFSQSDLDSLDNYQVSHLLRATISKLWNISRLSLDYTI